MKSVHYTLEHSGIESIWARCFGHIKPILLNRDRRSCSQTINSGNMFPIGISLYLLYMYVRPEPSIMVHHVRIIWLSGSYPYLYLPGMECLWREGLSIRVGIFTTCIRQCSPMISKHCCWVCRFCTPWDTSIGLHSISPQIKSPPIIYWIP